MRGRDRDRDRGAAAPKKKVIEITSRTVAVKEDPEKYSETICQLQKGTLVMVTEERTVEGVLWMNVICGWISSIDSIGYQCYVLSNDVSANKAWAKEYDDRRRLAGAVAAMLTKTHAIHNAQRVARAIKTHVNRPQGIKLVNLPDVSIEDLMVGLASVQGLRQSEVLEFVKIAASQQCNPPKALKDIAQEVYDLMNMRPTLWIKEKRNVLETSDVTMQNDQFVMAAARGDVKNFNKYLAMGQELAALHSDLKYTALHAAADFGHVDIVKRLINTGISVNIRDARKGQTPLHFAGQGGRAEVARMLLDAGADRTIASYKGKLPYEIADEQGNFECREILKHPPPAIQYVTVEKVSTTSIILRWDPPVLHEALHSRITDFVVEWIPEGKASEVGHGERFYTKKNQYKINNLQPSSGHAFAIFTRSPAGWSQPSSKLIQFTLPAPPDTPPPPEMLRLSTNAVYLAWHAPAHDNGAKVDMYQLELVDCTIGKAIADREAAERHRVESLRAAAKLERKLRRKRLKGSASDNNDDIALHSEDEDQDINDDDFDDVDIAGDPYPEGVEEVDDERLQDKSMSIDENMTEVTSLEDPGSVANPRKLGGGLNMLHRIFKHKQVLNRRKQCMGLEPFRPYQCRVRCHNELGYSAWSEWIGPIVPQAGVYVLEFNREERSARIGWFRPLLSNGRKVKHFEAQIARLDGPVSREIAVYGEVHPIEKASPLNYTTLQSDLTTNELVLKDLQAGSRYTVRVRYQVYEEPWSDWTTSFSSDPILVPACAPECPFHIRPALKPPKDLSSLVMSVEEDGETTDGGHRDPVPNLEELSTASRTSAVEVDADGEAIYEVKHNEIIIQWTNGVMNGSPAVEYRIEMAKLRDYTQADMDGAFAAAQDPVHKSFGASQSVASFGANSPAAKKAESRKSGNDDSGSDGEVGEDSADNTQLNEFSQISDVMAGTVINLAAAEQLKWRDVSAEGHMMGPAAFRMPGLIPGSSYIFRTKVRNEYGWSSMSAASPVITTFPCTPPGKPEAIDINSGFFYLRWNESDGEALGLTNLDFQVQIAKIPLGEKARANTLFWGLADMRPAPRLCVRPYVGVLVDKLSTATLYACRVRVRTIAGWSAWSEISDIIRTTAI